MGVAMIFQDTNCKEQQLSFYNALQNPNSFNLFAI